MRSEDWVRTLPLLLASTLLLAAAAAWAFREGLDEFGSTLLAGGLVTLGAWIATHVGTRGDREEHDDDQPST